MTDYCVCYTGAVDDVLETGKGHLAGVIVTSTSAVSGACSLYDESTSGAPTGPKIYEVMVNANSPVITLFNDRYAPRFHEGIYLHLSDDCYAMIWFHIPPVV
jgi:hypothetical protein